MVELLKPEDLSKLIGKPTTTLAQWRWLGTGPAYVKIGRNVRYRTVDVEAWLEDNTSHPSGAA